MFKIGTVAQLTGLSPNGIRFYEEKRLVAPERGANGKYRDFSAKTLSELMDVKNYRCCGFSLEEAAETIASGEAAAIASAMDSHIEKIEREMERQHRLMGYLEKRAAAIRALEARPPASFREGLVPSIDWLALEQEGQKKRTPAPRDEVCAWLSKTPFVDSCLLFEAEALETIDGPMRSTWGLAVESEQAMALGLDTERYAERHEGRRSAIAVVEIDDELRMTGPSAQRLRSLLKAEGIVPANLMISRRLVNIRSAKRERRYDELWVPLE
jgi:MerR family copper efflux transcriptional regulator